jgi:pimeloyl-ACP methyl ester carboxylesterase
MGEFNVEDTNLMLRNPAEWELKSRQDADVLLKATKAEIVKMFSTLLSDVDRNALSDDLVGHFQNQFKEAFRIGIRGGCDDSIASCTPWGFDPASIRVPVQIWHGRHDRFVPFSHGEWLASRIPHAEAHLEKDEGHITLITRRIPEVHRWLVTKF